MKRKKVAIVVQRCGQYIQAGAEIYAFNLAKALASHGIAVEIVTSQSDDYIYWNNNLPTSEIINTTGIEFYIKRFPVLHTRQRILFALVKRFSSLLNLINKNLYQIFSPILDHLFLKSQGPWCPELWKYLKENESNFDLIIVKSYLYAPNVFSLTEIKNTKKLFIVTAHAEPEFNLNFVKKALCNSDILGFVSKAEKELCHTIWPLSKEKSTIILPPGLPEQTSSNLKEDIRPEISNYAKKDFFLYLGRIDKNKNVEFIFENTPPDSIVLFAGDLKYPIPNDPRFVYIGRINETEKDFLLKNAIALVIASRLEAYSIVTAEAIKSNCLVLALKGCGPIDELIEEYGGLSCLAEDFRDTMRELQSTASREVSLKSGLIIKEKSWDSNAIKIIDILNNKGG